MNLTNFLAYIKTDFRRTDKDSEITQAYNDSVLAVALKMPHGAYKYQSYVPVVAAQEDYPLPSTIMHLLHPVKLLEGTGASDSGKPLVHVSKAAYDELNINPNRTSPDDTGEPDYYTIYSGSVLVAPTPSATEVTAGYLIEIDWTKVPTDMSAGADLPALPDNYREVLKWMTLDRVFAGIGLYQEAQYWQSRYQDQAGEPVGLYRDLLEAEKDKELRHARQVKFNDL